MSRTNPYPTEHTVNKVCKTVGTARADIASTERRLTSEFAELVRACQDTGKTGKLAVTIGVGVDGKLVRVVADSKVTVPKPSLEGTSFFADDRGGNDTAVPVLLTTTRTMSGSLFSLRVASVRVSIVDSPSSSLVQPGGGVRARPVTCASLGVSEFGF